VNHIKSSDCGELIFWKETLEFAKKWAAKAPERSSVHKNILEQVARIAAEPVWAVWYYDNILVNEIRDVYQAGKQGRLPPPRHEIHKIADLYQMYPDFFPALLNHLRKRWAKLEKSQTGRVIKFLALTFGINPYHKEEEKKLLKKGDTPYRYQFDPHPHKRGNELSIGQLRMAFQNATGEDAKESLFTKARRQVYGRLASVDKLNRTFFNEAGVMKLR
jgi:hypothetical protein